MVSLVLLVPFAYLCYIAQKIHRVHEADMYSRQLADSQRADQHVDFLHALQVIASELAAARTAQQQSSETLVSFTAEVSNAVTARMDELNREFDQLSTRVAIGAGKRVLHIS